MNNILRGYLRAIVEITRKMGTPTNKTMTTGARDFAFKRIIIFYYTRRLLFRIMSEYIIIVVLFCISGFPFYLVVFFSAS